MSSNHETHAQGVESKPVNTDPFAAHRESEAVQNGGTTASPTAGSPIDRRMSADEWDASKTPPSRFQHRKGSLYATPGSRDGHVDRNKERDKPFHELADKMKSGLFGGKRRDSHGEVEEKSGFFGGRRKSSSRSSDEKKEVVDK